MLWSTSTRMSRVEECSSAAAGMEPETGEVLGPIRREEEERSTDSVGDDPAFPSPSSTRMRVHSEGPQLCGWVREECAQREQ